jgi:hypothetical protein
MRYSPKPIEKYGRFVTDASGNQVFVGPSTSLLLKNDPERWNLAFLSYDYDARPVPPNNQFTSLVLKTVVTRLDTGALDLTESLSAPLLVRSLLRMPAPQFVKVIEYSAILTQLPLYKALGNQWLSTIKERSWLCSAYVEDEDELTVESMGDAMRVLAAIAARK